MSRIMQIAALGRIASLTENSPRLLGKIVPARPGCAPCTTAEVLDFSAMPFGPWNGIGLALTNAEFAFNCGQFPRQEAVCSPRIHVGD